MSKNTQLHIIVLINEKFAGQRQYVGCKGEKKNDNH